ncbi:unnamed protein product [Schistosoma mattheei]|uniref:Uncharacterized protein n=1 Tax=Schistosoma mattheei TaxID=31246 RepID=A0A183NDJ3_9TREM|nr:unnamed protein product [Schistosoma mattheei]
MKSADLPLIPVMTSCSQCIPNGDISPITSSVPLEAHAQIRNSNVKALKNAVKIKRPIACRKNVPSGSRPQIKNITVVPPCKNILHGTVLFY